MKTSEIDAISIFSKDIFLNLTINQISKRISKSYAYTNSHIRELISEGILSKKIVGPSILCSLNFSNEKTLGLLMLNSIEDKMAYLSNIDKKTQDTFIPLKNIQGIRSVFITNGKMNLICEDKEKTKEALQKIGLQKGESPLIFDKNEFKLAFRNIDMQNLTIIEGYESFWRLISEMMS